MNEPGDINIVFLFGTFDGRIDRRRFWLGLGLLGAAACGIAGAATVLASIDPSFMSLGQVLITALLLPLAALAAKRWHDRGRSGFWSVVVAIPLAGPLFALYELGFVPGMSERFAARGRPLAAG